jgi:hypothetical protein
LAAVTKQPASVTHVNRPEAFATLCWTTKVLQLSFFKFLLVVFFLWLSEEWRYKLMGNCWWVE